MRKELLFAFTTFFFMSLHAITGTFAQEQVKHSKVIHSYHQDVTGDGQKDDIILKGVPYSKSTGYLKQIWADIKTSKGEQFRIDYSAGYDPKIEFVDLNHDGVMDLLQSSATGGSGGLYNHSLHTLVKLPPTKIPLPDPLNIQAQFVEGYEAKISFADTNQSYKVNLKNRKKEYERLGIYKDGKLNEPTELMIDPYAQIVPSEIKGKNGFGLKAIQRVSGAYHADSIGDAISYWYYENGKWKLINVDWKEIKPE